MNDLEQAVKLAHDALVESREILFESAAGNIENDNKSFLAIKALESVMKNGFENNFDTAVRYSEITDDITV